MRRNLTWSTGRKTSLLIVAILALDIGSPAAAQQPAPQSSSIDAGTGVISDAERLKIEEALPSQVVAEPKKRRKLLIFDVNVATPDTRRGIMPTSLFSAWVRRRAPSTR